MQIEIGEFQWDLPESAGICAALMMTTWNFSLDASFQIYQKARRFSESSRVINKHSLSSITHEVIGLLETLAAAKNYVKGPSSVVCLISAAGRQGFVVKKRSQDLDKDLWFI